MDRTAEDQAQDRRIAALERDIDIHNPPEGRLSLHEQIADLRRRLHAAETNFVPPHGVVAALEVIKRFEQRVQALEEGVGPLAFLVKHIDRIKSVLGLR